MNVARWTSACALAVIASISSAQPYPPEKLDGPIGRFLSGQSITSGISTRGIDFAEKLSADVFVRRARVADGTWELASMYDGYAEAIRAENKWEQYLEKLQQWEAAYPDSPTALVAEATYWITYAELARGGAYASQVPPKAWELYNARITRARKVLESKKQPDNPHWYAQMLTVAYAQDWPAKDRLELFKEAIRKEPYYYTHYFRLANRMTPRWGGTLEEYHAFVEASVANTRERDGPTLYARLYWILAAIESNQDPFEDLGIPWDKMRQGFDELMKQYPNSEWNLNNYAYFACRANDAKTFGRLVKGIERPMELAWHGSYTFDYCKELLLKRV